MKDEYHAIDTEVTDVDMNRSPIGKILFKITYKEDYCYAIKPNENIYYTEWNENINIDKCEFVNKIKEVIKNKNIKYDL